MRLRWRILGYGLIAVLVVGLYQAKIGADATRAEVARLEAEVQLARAQTRTLAIEAAHLSRPARIEALAARHLGLHPPEGPTPMGLDALDAAAPAPPLGEGE